MTLIKSAHIIISAVFSHYFRQSWRSVTRLIAADPILYGYSVSSWIGSWHFTIKFPAISLKRARHAAIYSGRSFSGMLHWLLMLLYQHMWNVFISVTSEEIWDSALIKPRPLPFASFITDYLSFKFLHLCSKKASVNKETTKVRKRVLRFPRKWPWGLLSSRI